MLTNVLLNKLKSKDFVIFDNWLVFKKNISDSTINSLLNKLKATFSVGGVWSENINKTKNCTIYYKDNLSYLYLDKDHLQKAIKFIN